VKINNKNPRMFNVCIYSKNIPGECLQLMSVILATQEGEIRRITVQNLPQQID
jgi:hypothetical protein